MSHFVNQKHTQYKSLYHLLTKFEYRPIAFNIKSKCLNLTPVIHMFTAYSSLSHPFNIFILGPSHSELQVVLETNLLFCFSTSVFNVLLPFSLLKSYLFFKTQVTDTWASLDLCPYGRVSSSALHTHKILCMQLHGGAHNSQWILSTTQTAERPLGLVPMGHMHRTDLNSTTKDLKTKLGCNHSPQKVVWNLQTKSNQVDSLLKQKYKYPPQDLNETQCLITRYSKCLGCSSKLLRKWRTKKISTYMRKDHQQRPMSR